MQDAIARRFSLLAVCGVLLAALTGGLVGCGLSESDAVAGYSRDEAAIDAFQSWLETRLSALEGFERRDAATEVSEDFRRQCRARMEGLGAVAGRAVYAYGIPKGSEPATSLCPDFGVPGWTRGSGESATPRSGRTLGWGEYHDEASGGGLPGYSVEWRFEQGEATVQVELILPLE